MKRSGLPPFLLALQATLAALLALLSAYYWLSTREANRQAAFLAEFAHNNRALQSLIADSVAYSATNRSIDPLLLNLGVKPARAIQPASPAPSTPAPNRR